MKKILRFLTVLVAVMVSTSVYAEDPTVTLDFTSNEGWNFPTANTESGTYTKGGYTISLAGAGFKYDTNQKYLLLGKNGATLTLPAFDFKVAKIEVVGRSGASGKVTQNIFVGNTAVSTETTGATGTYVYEIAPDYREVGTIYVLKVTNANNTQITKINIYGQPGNPGLETVATPTFSPKAGVFEEAQNVTISCTTEGASIYYTTDGTEPTAESTLYTAPIAVAETTTIKAFAMKEGMNDSPVVEGKFEINIPEVGVKWVLVNDASSLKAGDVIIIAAAKSNFAMSTTQNKNNRGQQAIEKSADNNELLNPSAEVQQITLVAAGSDTYYLNVGTGYLAAVSSSNNNMNTVAYADADANAEALITFANGTPTIVFQGNYTRATMQHNASSKLFSCYASASQAALAIYKKDHTDNPNYVPAPTFSVAAGQFTNPFEVEISCADVDAKVYYTTNGDVPTAESTAYTAPVAISETTTLKAVAVKGDNVSDVASVTYTYLAPKTLADVNTMAKDDVFNMGSTLVVTYVNGLYNYVMEQVEEPNDAPMRASATPTTTTNTHTWGLIYKSGLGLSAGQVIEPNWTGKVKVYGGLTELEPSGELTVKEGVTVDTPDPLLITSADQINAANLNCYVLIDDVKFDAATPAATASGAARNFTGTLKNNDVINFTNCFALESVEPSTYGVLGYVGVYNGTYQVYPIQISQEITGIETIGTEDAPAVYYNLQGVRVSELTPGNVYIEVSGRTARKVVK